MVRPVFSGIVDHRGRIEAIESLNGAARLWIYSSFTDIQLGESISVDGACLTVSAFNGSTFQVDLSEETLRLTIASAYTPGTNVNLERALRVGDRLGGHWVTGHVDTTLTVTQVEDRADCRWIRIDGVQTPDRPLLSRKGCVTVNGVSLTLNEVGDTYFTLLLVPHTLKLTGLQELRIGHAVNVEWDWMAKVVLQALQTRFSQKDSDEKFFSLH